MTYREVRTAVCFDEGWNNNNDNIVIIILIIRMIR